MLDTGELAPSARRAPWSVIAPPTPRRVFCCGSPKPRARVQLSQDCKQLCEEFGSLLNELHPTLYDTWISILPLRGVFLYPVHKLPPRNQEIYFHAVVLLTDKRVFDPKFGDEFQTLQEFGLNWMGDQTVYVVYATRHGGSMVRWRPSVEPEPTRW